MKGKQRMTIMQKQSSTTDLYPANAIMYPLQLLVKAHQVRLNLSCLEFKTFVEGQQGHLQAAKRGKKYTWKRDMKCQC